MKFFIGNLYLDEKTITVAEQKRLISNWNKTVQAEDEVYVLGGLIRKYSKDNMKLLQKLHGTKHLIFSAKDLTILKTHKDYRELFQTILPYKELKEQGYKIYLSCIPYFMSKTKEKCILLYSNELYEENQIFMFKDNNPNEEQISKNVNYMILRGKKPILINELLPQEEKTETDKGEQKVKNIELKAPKKRGRKPKETIPIIIEEVVIPKKRGRKPKVQVC